MNFKLPSFRRAAGDAVTGIEFKRAGTVSLPNTKPISNPLQTLDSLRVRQKQLMDIQSHFASVPELPQTKSIQRNLSDVTVELQTVQKRIQTLEGTSTSRVKKVFEGFNTNIKENYKRVLATLGATTLVGGLVAILTTRGLGMWGGDRWGSGGGSGGGEKKDPPKDNPSNTNNTPWYSGGSGGSGGTTGGSGSSGMWILIAGGVLIIIVVAVLMMDEGEGGGSSGMSDYSGDF